MAPLTEKQAEGLDELQEIFKEGVTLGRKIGRKEGLNEALELIRKEHTIGRDSVITLLQLFYQAAVEAEQQVH